SYLLSSTFVPVLSVWVLRHYHPSGHAPHPQPLAPRGRGEKGGWFSFDTLRAGYARLLRGVLYLRWPLVGAYLVGAGLVIWLVGGRLGTEIFPSVDAGQFQLRLRAPDGTRLEVTEEIAREALEVIKEETGKDGEGRDNVAISLGYVGLIPTSYPINTIYLW